LRSRGEPDPALDRRPSPLVYCHQVMHLALTNSIRVSVAREIVSIPAIRISGPIARAGNRA
jgi:hypothetical protein